MTTVPYEDHVIDQHNYVRGLLGRVALTKNAKLTSAARVHSNRMATGLGLSHDNWSQEIINTGYTWSLLGQNIAVGCNQETCITVWWNSPEHQAILLTPEFRHIGVNMKVGSDGRQWWTVNFGAP